MRLEARMLACACLLTLTLTTVAENPKVVKYCRFQVGETVAYGIVEGETVTQLSGDLFGKWEKTDKTHKLSSIKLLESL